MPHTIWPVVLCTGRLLPPFQAAHTEIVTQEPASLVVILQQDPKQWMSMWQTDGAERKTELAEHYEENGADDSRVKRSSLS